MNDVRFFNLQQFAVVFIDAGTFDAVLFCSFFGAFHDDVAESNQLDIFDGFQCREMLAVGNAAAADDGNSKFFHVSYSFPCAPI